VNERMNEYDLSEDVTETVAGALYRNLSSKTAVYTMKLYTIS